MIYHYRSEDGRTATHEQPLAHPTPPPAEVVLEDGTVARRVYGAKPAASSAAWPLTCVASGVHPNDRQALADHLAKHGVPTEVTKHGDPVYTSPEHRRRALKARGFVDRNSFA